MVLKLTVPISKPNTLYNYDSCQLSGRQLLFQKAAQLVVLDMYFLEKLRN